jgi:glycosyltransferase involved in cell wall biosynthesis
MSIPEPLAAEPASPSPHAQAPRSDVRLVGFRYHPAIGGAEQSSRRLLREIGDRLAVDVVTLVTSNRTDWLRLLIDGTRDVEERYSVDGRPVCALPRWPLPVRRRLRLLAPFYHLPQSPAPSLMAGTLAPSLSSAVSGTGIVHNVFMGREAFSLGLARAAHRQGLPFVFTPLRHQRPLGWNSPAFCELYRTADALIAMTQDEADFLVRHAAPRERIRVTGIGPLADPSASVEIAHRLLGPEPFVLFLGQLHEYKGFRQVLAAAAHLRDIPELRFVFAGPDLRGHASAFTAAGKHVTYLGMVDDATRDSLLKACLVLCVPSSRESFGAVIVDAWAGGVPVIGGPAAATRELIENGVDGFVVPQDPSVIADRIRRLHADPALRREMGARGQTKVQRRFSWATIAQTHLDLYQHLGAAAERAGR